jgi:hypothetical protein
MLLNPSRLLPWLAGAGLALAALACNTLAPPRPAVAWDTDPEAVVLSATFCCGLAPSWVAENYIPDVQIWGDGRIVWVEKNAAGGQRVLTGTLTPDQLTALLQQYVDAGFFGWDSNYGDYSITDGASQCVSVQLLSTGKQVCEYFTGAPAPFHQLVSAAASGAGAPGVEYVPSRAYVMIYPQDYAMPPTGDEYLMWPADSLGLSLEGQPAAGQWLEGEALAFAWRVVAGNTWQPLVREGDKYYLLTVRVPGLSLMAPPDAAGP